MLQKNRSFQNDNSGGSATDAIKLSSWGPDSAGATNQVTQIQHLVAAGLKTAIFAVARLGVDDLVAVFALDSANTGVTVNEIFHQGVLIFTFPLFCCHRHPPLSVTGVWWIMKSIICQKCYGSVAVIKMVTATFAQ